MAHSLLCSSQFSCVISINTVDLEVAWKTVQILHQKPADKDLHLFSKEDMSGFSRTIVTLLVLRLYIPGRQSKVMSLPGLNQY